MDRIRRRGRGEGYENKKSSGKSRAKLTEVAHAHREDEQWDSERDLHDAKEEDVRGVDRQIRRGREAVRKFPEPKCLDLGGVGEGAR